MGVIVLLLDYTFSVLYASLVMSYMKYITWVIIYFRSDKCKINAPTLHLELQRSKCQYLQIYTVSSTLCFTSVIICTSASKVAFMCIYLNILQCCVFSLFLRVKGLQRMLITCSVCLNSNI